MGTPRIIRSLSRFVKRRFLLRLIRDQNGEDDSDKDEFDVFAISALKKIKNWQYLFQNNIRKRYYQSVFDVDLHHEIDEEAQSDLG